MFSKLIEFGMTRENDTLPRKNSLEKIIKFSDAESHYFKHLAVHGLEEDEKY
jgi:hypothetical protein